MAGVLDFSYQLPEGVWVYWLRWALRRNFGSHATDAAKTDIGGRSETDLLHRGKEGAACQDKNINDTQSAREGKRHREMNFM